MASINKTQHQKTYEGARAVRLSPEQELRRAVSTCLLWEDVFYEGGESLAHRIRDLTQKVSLEFASALAVEAREVMHLRHVPLWIVTSMAPRGGSIVGSTLARVVQRPDELTEFLALYWAEGRKPLSAQVKKGLAKAFLKFDAYALAKYNRKNPIKLRDVMFLVHPKPQSKEQEALWKSLVEGTLSPPGTWENRLSSGEDKKTVWESLLQSKALGGLALLRNLRNMQDAGVSSSLVRESTKNHPFSRVLPFRFIAAARHAPNLEDVLEEAMLRSVSSLPKLPGKTVLVLDNSGSMDYHLSGSSDLTRADAAAGVAILLRELCEEVAIVGFGSDAAFLPNRRGFALAEAYRQGPGGGTRTENAKSLADTQEYDRIIILTDEQSHQSVSQPKGKGYIINVATYEKSIAFGEWVSVNGWSESVARFIHELEKGEGSA